MMVRGHTDPEPNMEVSLWCWAFMALRGSFKTAITEGRAVMTTPRLAKAWQKNQRAATLLRCLLMGRMFWEEREVWSETVSGLVGNTKDSDAYLKYNAIKDEQCYKNTQIVHQVC